VNPVEDGIAVVWSSAVTPTGISGYLVTARSARHSVSVPVRAGSSGYTIRGLSAGESYVVTVRAYSAFGDSLSAPGGPVTPIDLSPPAPPRGVAVQPGIGAAVVSWTVDPRSFPLGARVVVKAGAAGPGTPTDGRAVDVARGTTSRVGGLAAGTTYSFAVFARDRFGHFGTPSAAVAVDGSSLTLRANKASIVRGSDVVLSGALRNTRGSGIGGVGVTLMYRPVGTPTWQLYDVAMTGRGGLYSFDVQLPATGDVQASFRGGGGALGSVSQLTRVVVRKPAAG
jgi:hypothetical protein